MSRHAGDFARRFAEYWKAPTADRLDEVLAPDARLVAPMMPTTEGLLAGKRTFAALLEAVPDLTGEVRRWGATDDGVLIEFTLSGTVGGKPISWDAVDRFVIGDDGLASERISYFDSVPVALAVALRPRAWPAFTRARLRTRR